MQIVKLTAPNGEDVFEETPFLDQEWEKWKKDHKKSYDSPEEEARRKQIFEDNLKKQEHINESEGVFSVGENSFMDLTE